MLTTLNRGVELYGSEYAVSTIDSEWVNEKKALAVLIVSLC